MSEKRHAVKVSIVGEEFTVRSDETPEHTQAVAKYVDEAIKLVLKASPAIELQKAAILAALQITDQLFKSREHRADLEGQLDTLAAEIRRWLPPGKRCDTGEHVAIQ